MTKRKPGVTIEARGGYVELHVVGQKQEMSVVLELGAAREIADTLREAADVAERDVAEGSGQ